MGRSETPIDPTLGPLEQFAHDLQVLRRQVGEPTYRTMSRRTGVSHTGLSQVTKGRQLPTLHMTLAFVRACGGDGDTECYWRGRWEQVRDALAAQGSTADSMPVAGCQLRESLETVVVPDSTNRGEGRHRPHNGRVKGVIAGLVIACVIAAVSVFATIAVIGDNKTISANPQTRSRMIVDGSDPYIFGCGRDQQPLEHQPVYRSDGIFYGWIVLFYSASCEGIWGYVVGPNSTQWRVYIEAIRMDDGVQAPSSFQGDARPNSWGNALSTTTGCVQVKAWVDNGPVATTSCWRPDGPVVHER